MRRIGGAWPIAALALGHAGLSLWLALDGHAPSRGVGFIPREHHYAAQVGIALLLYPALWRLMTAIVRRLVGGSPREVADRLGWAYGAPLLLIFVVPDTYAYGFGGFAALGPTLLWSAPLAALATWALMTRAVASLGARAPRAFATATLALLAQAIVAAAFLR